MTMLTYPSFSTTPISKSWSYYRRTFDYTTYKDSLMEYRKWLWKEWKVVLNDEDKRTNTYSVEFSDEHLMTLFLMRWS